MDKKSIHVWLQWGALCLVGMLAVGFGAYAYYGSAPKVIVEGNYIEAVQPLVEAPIDIPVNEELGALVGPNISSRYISINGITKYYLTGDMKTATTTLCSFPNPFGTATSTLESFDYNISTGTSTAATLVVNASTKGYASSTATNIIAAQTVASTAQDSLSWMSADTADTGEVSPSEFILLQTEGAGLSGYTYTGTCAAVFRRVVY